MALYLFFGLLKVALKGQCQLVLSTQVNFADPDCFLIMDQTIGVVLDELVFNGGIVESSGHYRDKFLLLVLRTHLVGVPLLILRIEDSNSLLDEMESNVMLGHLRIDGADVDVGLRHVCLLGWAAEHLSFDLDHHLQVLYRDILLEILLMIHAEVVVSHRHGAT